MRKNPRSLLRGVVRLDRITINGEDVTTYARHTRHEADTYVFQKPLSETYPLFIEITDQIGHKTTKILFEERKKFGTIEGKGSEVIASYYRYRPPTKK